MNTRYFLLGFIAVYHLGSGLLGMTWEPWRVWLLSYAWGLPELDLTPFSKVLLSLYFAYMAGLGLTLLLVMRDLKRYAIFMLPTLLTAGLELLALIVSRNLILTDLAVPTDHFILNLSISATLTLFLAGIYATAHR